LKPLFGLTLLLFMSACTTTPVTQVVLVIDFEPEALSNASRVEVRVIGGAGRTLESPAPVFTRVLDLSAMMLPPPWVLGLAPVGDRLDRAFEATVVVRDASDAVIVKQSVISSYVRGRTLELQLGIQEACRGVSCPDEPTTCRAGSCLDPWVDPTTLPDYSAASTASALDERGDAG